MHGPDRRLARRDRRLGRISPRTSPRRRNDAGTEVAVRRSDPQAGDTCSTAGFRGHGSRHVQPWGAAHQRLGRYRRGPVTVERARKAPLIGSSTIPSTGSEAGVRRLRMRNSTASGSPPSGAGCGTPRTAPRGRRSHQSRTGPGTRGGWQLAGGAGTHRARHVERPSQNLDSVGEPDETGAGLGIGSTDTVIGDDQNQRFLVNRQVERDDRGIGVLGDVRKRLRNHVIGGHLHMFRQASVSLHVQYHRN